MSNYQYLKTIRFLHEHLSNVLIVWINLPKKSCFSTFPSFLRKQNGSTSSATMPFECKRLSVDLLAASSTRPSHTADPTQTLTRIATTAKTHESASNRSQLATESGPSATLTNAAGRKSTNTKLAGWIAGILSFKITTTDLTQSNKANNFSTVYFYIKKLLTADPIF